MPNDKEIIEIDAEDLINEYNNYGNVSIEKYKNRIVHIFGKIVVKEFPKDKIPLRDASNIVFGEVDQRGNPFFDNNTYIVCYFDKIVVHDLNVGDMITVQCRLKSYGGIHRGMNRIVFNKGKIIRLN